MKNRSLWLVAVLLLCMSSGSFAAGNIGAGFQSSYPSYGFSAKVDLTDKFAVQGVLGFLGTVTSYSARGLMKIKQAPDYHFYGYGSVGFWSYDYSSWGYRSGRYGYYDDTETAVGFGGGGGIEYSMAKHLDGLPLTLNGELGIGIVNMDHYNFSAISVGVGAHYWF